MVFLRHRSKSAGLAAAARRNRKPDLFDAHLLKGVA
jgi:hypothetical protein